MWREWACSDDRVTEWSGRPEWLIYKYQCSLFTQTCKQQKVNNTAQLGLTNRLLLFHFRTWGVLDISQKLYWQQTQEGYEVTLTLPPLHGNRMHGAAVRGTAPPEAAKQGDAENPLPACREFRSGWSEQYLWAVPLQPARPLTAPRDLKALRKQTDQSLLHPLQIIPFIYKEIKGGPSKSDFPRAQVLLVSFPNLVL